MLSVELFIETAKAFLITAKQFMLSVELFVETAKAFLITVKQFMLSVELFIETAAFRMLSNNCKRISNNSEP